MLFQSWATLMTFIACMIHHPEVQRKGQAEIDKVVGSGRLPEFEDRASLPYVQAILQETMRYVY